MVKANSVILSTCLTAFCLLMIYASQQQVDLDTWHALNKEDHPLTVTAIDGNTIRKLDLGYHRLTSDLLWLSSIQYLGSNSYSQEYPALSNMIEAVTAVDPKFEYPYLFGGIILPWQGEPEAAITLLDKGWQEFPNNGLFPYNAGAIARIHLNNPELAATYLQKSIGLEDTPAAAQVLAGANLSKLSNREFALAWWNSILDTEQNEDIKQRALIWRDHLTIVIALENIVKEANQAGYTINKLSDLVKYGYLTKIPHSPLGDNALYLNTETGLVDIMSQ